jgi:hypothetical protein
LGNIDELVHAAPPNLTQRETREASSLRVDRPTALMGVNFAPFGNRVDASHFRNGAMN